MSFPAVPYLVISPTAPVAITVQPTSPGQVTISPAGLPGPSGGTLAYAIAPVVTTLAYGTAVTVNASLGNYFRLLLTGSGATLETPEGGLDAQQITIEFIEDDAGSRTVSWADGYEFAAIPQPTLSTGPGKRDLTGFIYNAESGLWQCVAALIGY